MFSTIGFVVVYFIIGWIIKPHLDGSTPISWLSVLGSALSVVKWPYDAYKHYVAVKAASTPAAKSN